MAGGRDGRHLRRLVDSQVNEERWGPGPLGQVDGHPAGVPVRRRSDEAARSEGTVVRGRGRDDALGDDDGPGPAEHVRGLPLHGRPEEARVRRFVGHAPGVRVDEGDGEHYRDGRGRVVAGQVLRPAGHAAGARDPQFVFLPAVARQEGARGESAEAALVPRPQARGRGRGRRRHAHRAQGPVAAGVLHHPAPPREVRRDVHQEERERGEADDPALRERLELAEDIEGQAPVLPVAGHLHGVELVGAAELF
mmetsp:Transcript_25349/g.65884  ORF Transcript_25349/g.65884 Transcript_25349/m.65884 type:complete len:251 (+) Transcript_25349:14991-15743(+)